MRKNFIRSEQKFWISRQDPECWHILEIHTNKKVGEISKADAYLIEEEFGLCDSLEEIQEQISCKKRGS